MTKPFLNKYIHSIRIPTPFAVGDVFSYLITDEKNILVDCGPLDSDAFSTVKQQLQKQDLGLSDIDEIWLTHGHPDHFGQAKKIAERAQAIIKGHKKEHTNFSGNDDRKLFKDLFEYHKIPEPFTRQMIKQLDDLQRYLEPIEPGWVGEGDVLSSGKQSFEVHFTPGHAAGHVVFQSGDVILGGDLLLDHISTNALINFDPDTGRRNKSLLQYRQSLKWIRSQPGMVLPGHGEVITDISGTASRHLKEQEIRYQKILKILRNQPLSLLNLAEHIFSDAIEDGAIFLVLSEVLGYLDWGMQEGTIELLQGDIPTYRTMKDIGRES